MATKSLPDNGPVALSHAPNSTSETDHLLILLCTACKAADLIARSNVDHAHAIRTRAFLMARGLGYEIVYDDFAGYVPVELPVEDDTEYERRLA